VGHFPLLLPIAASSKQGAFGNLLQVNPGVVLLQYCVSAHAISRTIQSIHCWRARIVRNSSEAGVASDSHPVLVAWHMAPAGVGKGCAKGCINDRWDGVLPNNCASQS